MRGLVLLLTFACGPVPPQLEEPGRAALPFPLGVASLDGQLGFMRTPDGGTRALALSDGSELWVTSDRTIPLFAEATDFVAAMPVPDKPSDFRLAVLDARSGRQKTLSERVALPPWAVLTGARDVQVQFRAMVSRGEIAIEWCASSVYGSGANPSDRIEREARRTEKGRVRLHLAKGTVVVERPPDAASSCAASPPPPGAIAPPEAVAPSRVGDHLYYLLPSAPTQRSAARAKLVAADAATGAVQWSRDVAIPAQPRALPYEIRKD